MRRVTWLVHPLALAPVVLLATDLQTVNPIQAITQHSGRTALILLLLCLACTPLNLFAGWKWAVGLRKPLGLYSFLYVSLHLITFGVLDYGLNWELIGQTVVEKRYVLAGFAAFLLLVPLAITSTKGWKRRLGRNWKRLHRLVYVAAILAVLHFLWLSKVARDPLIFGAILVILLSLRLPVLRVHAGSFRSHTLTKTADGPKA